METSKFVIQKLAKDIDVILVQEHWYFDCQLNRINMVCDDLLGVGKATDTGACVCVCVGGGGKSNPSGSDAKGLWRYGILWQKKLDHLITPIADGGNRIQCFELQG